jgi:hypothetical protein
VVEKARLSKHGWEWSLHVVTGVPPLIMELVDLEALLKEHSKLTDKVYGKPMTGLQE